jgi:hypothetical protein
MSDSNPADHPVFANMPNTQARFRAPMPTMEQPEGQTHVCFYCGADITEEVITVDGERLTAWVDETGGDVCSGNDALENENEPHKPGLTFTVSIRNDLDAVTPEHAVRQFIEWVVDNAYHAGYRVEDDNGFVGFYDGDRLGG